MQSRNAGRLRRSRRGAATIAFCLGFGLLVPGSALAADPRAGEAFRVERGAPTGLGFRFRAGTVHQFDAGLDGGGEFQVTRAFGDLGARYAFREGTSTGLSIGYAWDDYDFSSSARLGGRSPWGEVHRLRLSLPTFWEAHPSWRFLAIPILRFSAESPNDWGNAVSGGGILGFSYRFDERLRIGPGVGVLSEIEDDPTIFPVVVVDWRPTDRLRIDTGRGLGSSNGPGLRASYELSEWWQVSVGARYERLRFRLDQGNGSGNVGEDRSLPAFAGLRFGLPFAHVSLVAGAEFLGRLRLEDDRGRKIESRDYDPAPFVGLTIQAYF